MTSAPPDNTFCVNCHHFWTGEGKDKLLLCSKYPTPEWDRVRGEPYVYRRCRQVRAEREDKSGDCADFVRKRDNGSDQTQS